MGRELQKKKNKSSLPRVKHKPKSKKLNLKGNPVVAANWYFSPISPPPPPPVSSSSFYFLYHLPLYLKARSPSHPPPGPLNPTPSMKNTTDRLANSRDQKQTLSQNYRRLGLVSKLHSRAGGVEMSSSDLLPAARLSGEKRKDGLAIANAGRPGTLIPGSARIVRDEGTGEVVRVVHVDGGGGEEEKGKGMEWRGRTLVDDGLGDDEDERGGGGMQHDLSVSYKGSGVGEGGVVGELVRQASIMAGGKKRERKQSRREEEWVGRLVERYGDDVKGMVRDRRLNPMQQSEADIGRRVRLWRDARRKAGGFEDGGGEMDEE